jgi:hypothetical protein
MSKLSTLVISAAAAFAPLAAHAVAPQSVAWVSAQHGKNDATCGAVDTPCLTFQYAHDNIVASGGSIFVRDPGEYGAITITKPISVINDNVGAATITVGTSSNAITVAPAVAGPTLIKGLTLNGPGAGSTPAVDGIQLVNGSLTVANCTIKGFYYGVLLAPNFPASYSISDTLLTSNHGGLAVVQSIAQGLLAGTATRVIAANNSIGVVLQGTGGFQPRLMANQLSVTGNTSTGISETDALVYLRESTVTDNGIGIQTDGAVYTYVNNGINGNISADISGGALTAIGQQ